MSSVPGVCLALLPILLASAGVARAQIQEAQAETVATAAGDIGGSDIETRSSTASASFASLGDDEAAAQAETTVLGAVGARAYAGGASGSNTPSDAFGRAAWYSDLVTTGVDPGVPVDIDLELSIEGKLVYANNNGGPGPDDVRSSIRMEITVYDTRGPRNPFDGTAKLASQTNSTPAILVRTGDWLDPGRDGDFTIVECTRFTCQVDVDTRLSLPDVLDLDFGEPFAVEVNFIAQAHVFEGREVEAEADFLNTGMLTLATDTPGVGIQPIPTAAPVPGFGAVGLALLVILVGLSTALLARYRRLRARRHEAASPETPETR